MTVDPRMIGPATRVASAGSCFAQHIARSLREAGLCYHVTETGDHYAVAEATARQYGTFSARYGNLYTPKQLIQLMDRAYGKFVPVEPWWDIPGKGWADPFRPTVEPLGFASIKDAEDDRTRHLAAVRSLFETLDVFIYTLGLTEAWRSKQDGAVFPVVPGAVAGTFDDAKYEFVNYTTLELVQDLDAFQLRLAAVNPGAAVIYTVSPVPLVASYARDHVAVASSASKSALRAAAQEITSRVPRSYYFPSYEIITGPWTRGRYFAEDARSVTDEGVAHVMQTFRRHFVGSDASADRLGRLQPIADIVCDEELLDDLPDPAIEPLVIHLHVQKTGGSTLNAVLAEAYEEGRSRSVTPSSIGSEFASNSSGVDLLYGHLNVDDIEAIGRPTRLVAFVREPEPRLASAYDYFRVLDPLGPEGHALVKRAHAAETLEDFLDDSVVAISPEIWNHQTWALMGDRLWRQWRADVTMLPTDDISAYVDAQVAPVMRARLARFFYVGNFARLEHGIHELCVRLGRPAPTAIPHRNSLSDASDRNRLSTARTSHDTRTAHARNETPLTQHAHFWALDAALYRIALERFG